MEKKIVRKRTLSNMLLDFLTVALIALIFVPQFKFIGAYNFLNLSVTVLWCIIAFSKHPRFFTGGSKYFQVSIVFFLIAIFIAFFADNKVLVNRYSSFVMVPLFYWMYQYNVMYRELKANSRILFLSLPFILYTSIQTTLVLILNPFAARSIKTSTEGSEDLISDGVGGYGLIYSVVILVIVLVPLLLEQKKFGLMTFRRILLVSLGGSFLYLIILSNYFTALIVTILGVLAIIALYRNKRIFIFLIPVALLYFTLQKEINLVVIDTISEFVQADGLTHRRLQEIKTELTTGTKTESVDSRSEVVGQSIELLSEYPILGYATTPVHRFDWNRVGQHSYILDTYALYGLFLGTYSAWIMWLPFRYRITAKQGSKLQVYAWTVGIAFMLLITMNNLTATMGFASFFVFPTVFDYINKR